MSLVMLGTICESSMGVNLDGLDNKSEYISAIEDISELIRKRLFSFLPDAFLQVFFKW